MKELSRLYTTIRPTIEETLQKFKRIWEEGTEEDIFTELVFCILTPQCKPQICWTTVQTLVDKNLLFHGKKERVAKELNGARFKNKKAGYIVEARKYFPGIKSVIEKRDDVYDVREWLVEHVKGIGYKEASHFLRNIGHGGEIAILDRHILRNLESYGVVEEIPRTLTKKRYLTIEKKMKAFAKEIEIPMDHLDLVLWYKETGELFK